MVYPAEAWYAVIVNAKPFIWIGLFLGSTLGGLIPELWGVSALSFTGLLFSTIGGLVGVWLGWKIGQDYF